MSTVPLLLRLSVSRVLRTVGVRYQSWPAEGSVALVLVSRAKTSGRPPARVLVTVQPFQSVVQAVLLFAAFWARQYGL